MTTLKEALDQRVEELRTRHRDALAEKERVAQERHQRQVRMAFGLCDWLRHKYGVDDLPVPDIVEYTHTKYSGEASFSLGLDKVFLVNTVSLVDDKIRFSPLRHSNEPEWGVGERRFNNLLDAFLYVQGREDEHLGS